MTKLIKQQSNFVSKSARNLTLALLIGVMISSFALEPIARADQYDDQIRQKQAENAQNQSSADQLQAQANSYQDAVNKFQAQINTLQAQIRENQTKRDDLAKQIDIAQKELDKQKNILGQNIKAMYVEGDISTLEMLASSKDLSEFLDKQQYRDNVQQKVKTALDKVNVLKDQLREQKTLVDKLIADQTKIQSELAANQAKQTELLNYTEAQKNEFTAKISANNSQISALRAQQAAAYAAYTSSNAGYGIGEAGNGGYPSVWANAPQDSMLDDWGMYNRECVSYVAWKVASTGRFVPRYALGNAADWAANAGRYGIGHADGAPRVGSAVMWDSWDGLGSLGHVAYVETVNGDNSIEVSQYNMIHGQFSRMHVSAAEVSRLTFIYF